ncbi:MAG: cell envelope integrity protein TolA [Desulfobacterales bacterium]
MPARVDRMGEMGHNPRVMGLSFSVSMACHLIFFGLLVLKPGYQPRKVFSPPVINVSIVTLPSPEEAVEKKDSRVKLAADPVPLATKVARSKGEKRNSEAISVAPRKFKAKTSLKKKTFKSSTVLKRALSEIEKRVDESRSEPVVKAIDRLRKTIDETRQDPNTMERPGARDKRALELMDIYKAEIPYRIQKNWVFLEQLAGGRTDLVAWLVIEITPEGQIRNTWFEKRSGNGYFDEQAEKAVKKSSPLPPLPEGYKRPFFNVGLRFTPTGLK